jgi:hypothetical protein
MTIDNVSLSAEHQWMRTTLTLDDDVAAKLRSEVRRTGKPFKQVVNDALRESFCHPRGSTPFKVKPKDLGELQPGVNLDKICDVLELEGPGKSVVQRLRGTATIKMSTDEIMKLTRK